MGTSVATRQPPPQNISIRDHLKAPAFIAELAKVMPEHCKPERMARVALSTLTRAPKLANCTPASFFECLLALSQWGLEPDGRRAHLIPYGTTCQLIIDYKGYVELAYRSGMVKNIHADVVREGDVFKYSKGKLEDHVPHFLRTDKEKPKDAGKVYAAYCYVELKGGTEKCEVLSRDDVEAIRKRSRSGTSGPWTTDWNEMAKKSAFRRASKWLPLSADLIDAMDADADKVELLKPSSAASISTSKTSEELTSLLLESNGGTDDSDGNTIDAGSDEEPKSALSDSFWADCVASLDDCTDMPSLDACQQMYFPKITASGDLERFNSMIEARVKAIGGKKKTSKGQQSMLEGGEQYS